jgi:prepilin-type N-terminal cleavage/methylation domain-containing protein
MNQAKTKIIRNQKGFTLIEIIAVLVILGILAAVAVPKFVDLQTQASQKALDGALAAAFSTCSMQYARLLLANSAAPDADAVAAAATAEPPGADDFIYAFAANADDSGVTCTVTDAGDNTITKSDDWLLP